MCKGIVLRKLLIRRVGSRAFLSMGVMQQMMQRQLRCCILPFLVSLVSLQKNQEGMDLKPVSRNRRRSICFLRPFFLFLGLEKVEQLAIDSVSVKFVLNKHLKRVSTSFILKIDEFLAKSKRCPLQLGIVIFPSPILS